jgi:hypothetical protein
MEDKEIRGGLEEEDSTPAPFTQKYIRFEFLIFMLLIFSCLL